MSIKTQRQAIQATLVEELKAIDGINPDTVTDKIRRIDSLDTLINNFASSDGTFLQQFWVHRVGGDIDTNESAPDLVPARHAVMAHNIFQVNMYYGYKEENGPHDEASEPAFQDLVDDILDHFKDLRSLGGFTTRKPLGLFGDITTTVQHDVYFHQALFRVDVLFYEYGINPQ